MRNNQAANPIVAHVLGIDWYGLPFKRIGKAEAQRLVKQDMFCDWHQYTADPLHLNIVRLEVVDGEIGTDGQYRYIVEEVSDAS